MSSSMRARRFSIHSLSACGLLPSSSRPTVLASTTSRPTRAHKPTQRAPGSIATVGAVLMLKVPSVGICWRLLVLAVPGFELGQ